MRWAWKFSLSFTTWRKNAHLCSERGHPTPIGCVPRGMQAPWRETRVSTVTFNQTRFNQIYKLELTTGDGGMLNSRHKCAPSL